MDQQWEEYKVINCFFINLLLRLISSNSFQTKHSKSYPEPEEDARRKALFQESVAKIEAHNEQFKQGKVTWEMGINHFADQTPEERARCHGPPLPKKQ